MQVSAPTERAESCGCDAETIGAIHQYLETHFPGFFLHDFHVATRGVRGGLPLPQREHHAVSVTREDVLPYYALFPTEFLSHSTPEVRHRLIRWTLADLMRANRVVIISLDGAGSL